MTREGGPGSWHVACGVDSRRGENIDGPLASVLDISARGWIFGSGVLCPKLIQMRCLKVVASSAPHLVVLKNLSMKGAFEVGSLCDDFHRPHLFKAEPDRGLHYRRHSAILITKCKKSSSGCAGIRAAQLLVLDHASLRWTRYDIGVADPCCGVSLRGSVALQGHVSIWRVRVAAALLRGRVRYSHGCGEVERRERDVVVGSRALFSRGAVVWRSRGAITRNRARWSPIRWRHARAIDWKLVAVRARSSGVRTRQILIGLGSLHAASRRPRDWLWRVRVRRGTCTALAQV